MPQRRRPAHRTPGSAYLTVQLLWPVLAGFGLLRVWDPLTPQTWMGFPEHQYGEMCVVIALPRMSSPGAETLAVRDPLTRPSTNSARSERPAAGGGKHHGAPWR